MGRCLRGAADRLKTRLLQIDSMHGCCIWGEQAVRSAISGAASTCKHELLTPPACTSCHSPSANLCSHQGMRQAAPPQACACLLHLESASMQGCTAGWQQNCTAKCTMHLTQPCSSAEQVCSASTQAGLGVRSAEGKQLTACTTCFTSFRAAAHNLLRPPLAAAACCWAPCWAPAPAEPACCCSDRCLCWWPDA